MNNPSRSSTVRFLLQAPSSALTSRFIPFKEQEYKAGPVLAFQTTQGGTVKKSCKR